MRELNPDARLLIVDDSVANISLLRNILSRLGFTQIETITDSREACARVEAFHPDLIVLDYNMPHLNGLAVMAQLSRVISRDTFLPVLMLTADATAETKRKALSAGATDLLTKPFNSSELFMRIRNLLQIRFLHLQVQAQNQTLEQKVLERTRELRESQQQVIAQERLRAFGEMAGGIVHDCNNSLESVIGYSEMLLSDDDLLSDRKTAREFLQIVNTAGQDASQVIRSRETLRGILDNIPQRVFWKDRNSVYLGCNKPCAHDMGLSNPAEVIGLTDFELSWKAVADIYQADDRAIMALDAPKLGFEEPGLGADGELGWIRTTKVPLHDGVGKVIGILGTYEDVTAHKRAKEEIERLNAELEQRVVDRTASLLAATLEAERANNAKSDFLGRISHELRTPMNAILGFGQLLEMEENLGAETRESVDQILLAGRRLLTLINEMLDLSGAKAGRLSFSLEPVKIEAVLAETLELVRPLALSMEIALPLSFPAWSRREVLADRKRLKQVLLDLFANAIKYNRRGGAVSVDGALVAGTLPSVRLSIIDTGHGIAAEKLSRLFTPFDRLDTERVRNNAAGSGLGLALSKQVMESMGGALGVTSVEGQGSCFWVELPLAGSGRAPLGG